MSAKLSLVELKSLASLNGGILVSNKYINIKTPLKWQCSEFHSFERSAFDVKYLKYWCSKCNGRHSVEDYIMWASNVDAKFIEKVRIGKVKKIKLVCNSKQHEWIAHPSHTKKGHGCPECAGTKRLSLEDAKVYASNKGGTCTSTEYKNALSPLSWKCIKGHKWKSKIGIMRSKGTWCPTCANESNRKWTKSDAEKSAILNKGQFLGEEFTNRVAKYDWKCIKNHEFKMQFDSVLKGRWCPKCKFKKEQKVREIFESLTGKLFPSKRPKWLKNHKSGGTLCLDGLCEELSIAFEYDGEQHFKEVDFCGDRGLEYRQANDKLKDALCKNNGIKLIRISYDVQDVAGLIREKLMEIHSNE